MRVKKNMVMEISTMARRVKRLDIGEIEEIRKMVAHMARVAMAHRPKLLRGKDAFRTGKFQK